MPMDSVQPGAQMLPLTFPREVKTGSGWLGAGRMFQLLLLQNKQPQNLVAQTNHYIMLTDCRSRIWTGHGGYVSFMVSGAPSGKTQ